MSSVQSLFAFLFLTFSLSLPVQAFNVPAMSSPVVDQAGLLPPSAKRQIEDSLFQFKQTHQAQIQVLIVSSLEGDAIESVAIQVFDKWKIGDEKRDDGILFLIAPNEKRMRIEVGQGLEGVIPDAIAIRIIADVVRPYFQRSEYSLGVMQGVAAIQSYISSGQYADQIPPEQRHTEKKPVISGKLLIFILGGLWLLIFMISPSTALHLLLALLSGGGRGRGGGDGGSSGGSWGGGGGSSSGGGASGGW